MKELVRSKRTRDLRQDDPCEALLLISPDILSCALIRNKHIPGADQPADILTKQLPVEAMRKHIQTLGMTRV